jgi:hypothetical protein
MSPHEIPQWAVWHGRLMVAAWAVLLPLGIVIARFFKVTAQQSWPQSLDNKFWWRSHLILQYSGIAVMTAATIIVVSHLHSVYSGLSIHGMFGWVVVILGWLQVLGGLLRGSKGGPPPIGQSTAPAIPGDHYDMSRRRVIFEFAHKLGGYLALMLSVVAITLGLRLVNAPTWMFVVIVAGWTCGLASFVWLQRRGRCVDTYQAIWGPSLEHPGNLRRPIGWGICRLDPMRGDRRISGGSSQRPTGD